MATTPRLAAATPSPPPNLHTPPTPRLGFADNWEPFSPRKSSRLSSRSAAAKPPSSSPAAGSIARTPSPSANTRRATRLRSPRSPRVTKQGLAPEGVLTAASAISPAPTPTPRKKKASASTMMGAHNGHHHLSPGDASSSKKAMESRAARAATGMLPTPAKTPSKKQHTASQNESNIAAIARNLFHTDVDEVMSSPSTRTKRGSASAKKYTGYSLESFQAVDEDIPIFTDSQDRLPEVDNSTENPFYGDGAAASPPAPASARRRSTRRNNQVSIPGEGRQSVEEASRREDGLVYVFRGKKLFRKFEDASASLEEDILEGVVPGNRRLTRSSMQPRLLFPREEIHEAVAAHNVHAEGVTDDEEAVTDIEDHVLQANGHAMEIEEEEEETDIAEDASPVGTPADLVDCPPNTPPNAPKYAPASPPVTGRATRRSTHKAAPAPLDMTPGKSTSRAKKRSPFDGWRQTKSSTAAGGSHKRPGDELGTTGPAVKRTRA